MKVGIIGAGTMGQGITLSFVREPGEQARRDNADSSGQGLQACEGNSVLIADVSLELAQKGVEKIYSKLDKLAAKGKISQSSADYTKQNIRAAELTDFVDCKLVVEAALEDMAVKKDIFKRLENICGTDTVFASNTSSLSLTEMSNGLERPVIGMHFFNPADTMKLVEIIAGENAPQEQVDFVSGVASDIGKTPVVVSDSSGFVVNRLLIPMINEAVGILSEGVADAEGIDTAMKLGANHPMGPLALADLIGLDVCLAIMETLCSEFGDTKYRPHPLLRKLVRAGALGRKSGRGFFHYPRND